jgi:hypothetical protein
MLTLKRHVGGLRTPMLVPSFSSKTEGGLHGLNRIEVERFADDITSPVLISAYDIGHDLIRPPTFPDTIFLDSGGYEALQDFLTERPGLGLAGKPWDEDSYAKVLRDLEIANQRIIAVSYDHPREPLTLKDQLDRATRLFPDRDDLLREFLIKPEPDTRFIDIQVVLSQLDSLANYPVIGLTDKELGPTMMDRLLAVAKLRVALTARGAATPIHIFGSLDPITSPLYFLAGADIFDGLAWLRYGFSEGRAIYRQNYDAVELDLHQRPDGAVASMWRNNSRYLVRLESDMRRFLLNADFQCFGVNAKILEDAWSNLNESLGG